MQWRRVKHRQVASGKWIGMESRVWCAVWSGVKWSGELRHGVVYSDSKKTLAEREKQAEKGNWKTFRYQTKRRTNERKKYSSLGGFGF